MFRKHTSCELNGYELHCTVLGGLLSDKYSNLGELHCTVLGGLLSDKYSNLGGCWWLSRLALEVKQRAEGTIPPVCHAFGVFFPAPPCHQLGNGREHDLLQPPNKF